jgi:hypothetical protein
MPPRGHLCAAPHLCTQLHVKSPPAVAAVTSICLGCSVPRLHAAVALPCRLVLTLRTAPFCLRLAIKGPPSLHLVHSATVLLSALVSVGTGFPLFCHCTSSPGHLTASHPLCAGLRVRRSQSTTLSQRCSRNHQTRTSFTRASPHRSCATAVIPSR